jgi:hypothetical protein
VQRSLRRFVSPELRQDGLKEQADAVPQALPLHCHKYAHPEAEENSLQHVAGVDWVIALEVLESARERAETHAGEERFADAQEAQAVLAVRHDLLALGSVPWHLACE